MDWQELQVLQEREREVLRICGRDGLPTGGYDDALFKRKEIIAMWPAPRAERTSDKSLTLIKPEGSGHMPLCCAAYWIATKGGAEIFDPCDVSVWEAAFSQLLARIASDEVTITGLRGGEREKINGHLFAGIRIDYPFNDSPLDLTLSDELYLYAGVYLDEEYWHRGFDDRLESRRGVKWGKLLVLKSDVARWWPFAASSTNSPYRTGAPGRPTSIQLVAAEHAARWDRGEALDSIGAESQALVRWLLDSHPSAPRLSEKTISNNLRAEHRRRRAETRK
jgi:hypothetical protein